MSKIFDQIKTLFNAFPEAVLILDRDFKLIWKNSNASFDLLADQGTLKELKVLTSGQISKAVIPTSHGMKNVCISPLHNLFILFVPDSSSETKNTLPIKNYLSFTR